MRLMAIYGVDLKPHKNLMWKQNLQVPPFFDDPLTLKLGQGHQTGIRV